MNFIKGYLQPASKKSNRKAADEKKTTPTEPVELVVTPPPGSFTFETPAGSRPSRPNSVYPSGDFRNAPRESLLDIKSDVMVNWLHQQQLEKLWAMENGTEGVVLKKARGDFTCSPPVLRTQPFFEQVIAMNVRVSHYLLVVSENTYVNLCLNSVP